MKLAASVLALVAGASIAAPSLAAAPQPAVDGDYHCDACRGRLTLKRVDDADLQVWLGVGDGPCAGEALVNRKVRYTGGVLQAPHKQGQVQCFARIEFTPKGATVTDTCITPKDEQNSACAMLGTYSKRVP